MSQMKRAVDFNPRAAILVNHSNQTEIRKFKKAEESNYGFILGKIEFPALYFVVINLNAAAQKSLEVPTAIFFWRIFIF